MSAVVRDYDRRVDTVGLREFKDRLSDYVDEVERTHERLVITRHGRPSAVLMSPDDLRVLEDTVAILTTAGAIEAITDGLADLAAGRVADNDGLRARFSLG
jgi:prevent-host-death family protein